MAEITWQAPEFEYREKGVSWYWLSIIIAIIVLGIAVWQKNFLFGFFVVVAEMLILSWGNREPRMVEFRLSEKGLAISGGPSPRRSDYGHAGGKFYALQDFESFGTEESESEWQNVHLQFKNRLRPRIKIAVPKKKYKEVEKMLGGRIQQSTHEPSLLDTLEKFLRF